MGEAILLNLNIAVALKVERNTDGYTATVHSTEATVLTPVVITPAVTNAANRNATVANSSSTPPPPPPPVDNLVRIAANLNATVANPSSTTPPPPPPPPPPLHGTEAGNENAANDDSAPPSPVDNLVNSTIGNHSFTHPPSPLFATTVRNAANLNATVANPSSTTPPPPPPPPLLGTEAGNENAANVNPVPPSPVDNQVNSTIGNHSFTHPPSPLFATTITGNFSTPPSNNSSPAVWL
ncbi:unnamed protein product [Arabidopsis arenosa]|uniref:Uncharacterized protein n=1 Tax=Arabidopsis arenosa TaxID=38785 RepID=A0A8S2B1A4_ARAAE|nr:unnamed protein product [Arabidopsis arenosa]CAE6258672.1 unnamed protein product [Arabidopsis arenosa]CAE6258746.1 unnamed protein product [Arabidopsis arenosa]